VDYFIRRLKFHQDLPMARLLGQSLAASVAAARFRPDAIVPVPLHPRRLRRRGFNQSVEIARPLADRIRAPLIVDGVDRVRDTPNQAGLNRRERRRNLLNAFDVTADLREMNVAIVDDVMTTGETVRQLARALRKAGAGSIAVWVVARAV